MFHFVILGASLPFRILLNTPKTFAPCCTYCDTNAHFLMFISCCNSTVKILYSSISLMGCWNFVKNCACYFCPNQFPLDPCFFDMLQMKTTRWLVRPAAWFSPTLIPLRKGKQWMCPTRQGSSTQPSAWQICSSTSPRWNVLRVMASRKSTRWDTAFILLLYISI